MTEKTAGKLIKTYTLDKAKSKETRNLARVGLGLFGGFAVFFTLVGIGGLINGQSTGFIGLAVGGLFAFLIAVISYTIIKSGTTTITRVDLHENGIHLKNKNHDRHVLWQDIKSIKEYNHLNVMGTTTTQSFGATLTLTDDSTYSIGDNLIDFLTLRDHIRAAITPHIQQSALTTFESGQPLAIGYWTLDTQTITNPYNKSIAWDDVTSLTFRKGYMIVQQDGQTWDESKTHELPNIVILAPILQKSIAKILQQPKINIEEMPFQTHTITTASTDKVSSKEVR